MASHSLPQDAITDILTRVPVKSIIRFESVSKSWFSLFRTKFFIEKHLHCSTRSSSSLLLQRWVDDDYRIHYTDAVLLVSKITGPESHSPCFNFIIGVSNGLVCCYSHTSDLGRFLFLWNPATRKYRQIPQPNFCDDFLEHCYGFCFISADNDYKIVQLNRFKDGTSLLSSVEMFSMRNGCWREISFPNVECEFCSCNLSVTVNGAVFWMVKESGKRCVFSFDTGNELHRMIAVPSYDERARMKLDVYENSLALLVKSLLGRNYVVDLLVFDDSSNGFSVNFWQKLQTKVSWISPHPLGIWQNEILFRDNEYIYGHKDFKARVPYSALLFPRSFYYVFNYVESLVPVHGGNGVDEVLDQRFVESLFPDHGFVGISPISLYVKSTAGSPSSYYNCSYRRDDFFCSLALFFREE